MLKNVIAFIIFVCFTKTISAQENNYIDSCLRWLDEHPTIDSQYIQTLHRISYRYSEKDVKKSFLYYEKVSTLSDSLNFTYGKSLAQINLGLLLYNAANLNASNNAYFKAIDYAEECNALRVKAVSLNNAGDNFLTLKNYDKCRQYANQAIPINMQLKAWRGVAINYELLQRCDLNENLYASAKKNLDTGMPYALMSNDSYVLSQFYLGFGILHAVNNKVDSAKYYFSKAKEEALKQYDARNEYNVYIGEAKYLKTLTLNQQLVLLDSALGIAKKTHYYQGVSDAAEQLSLVYDKKNNKDSSLVYYRMYRAGFDSLFSETNKRNTIFNESQWLVNKKEIENHHLLEVAELQKKQIIFKNVLLLVSFVLLILVALAGFFINASIQSKKKRTEFALKQKIAELQLQSLRSQMNPHFIFNSLNSIENFMMQNEKKKASYYLHKFAVLIRTILDSSDDELTTVSHDMEALKLYVELEQMRFNNAFTYKEDIDPQLISGDYNVPSLLIQPYVENAIVHGIAHSDKTNLKLTVTATLENEFIKYTIEDNGVGRNQSADYNKMNKLHHRSVGLKITEERIRLFNHETGTNGHIKIIDLHDNENNPAGTKVEIKIKAV